MALTKDELLKLAKRLISIKNNQIDLTTGTVLQDLGVEAQAEILASLSNDIERVRQQQTFNSAYFTDEEADQLTQSFGITRKSAVKATGSVTFGTVALPSTSIVIPTGTTVIGTTEDNIDVTYTTTEQGIISSLSSFNPQTGYYETTVSITASSAGSASNIGIGYINKLGSSVSGVNAVYNKEAVVNGADAETTDALLNRFLISWRGRNTNTEQGILAWTYTNSDVDEAVVIGPRSEYSMRGPGAVDVYVRGSVASSATQYITSFGLREVYLTSCPVINPQNIIVTVDGTSYDINSGLFTFVKDEESIFQSSTQALDKIVLDENFPTSFTSCYITYSYDSVISNLQSMYDDTEQRLLTGDIMARATTASQIIMEFGITPESGYDKNSVANSVRSNIENFVNNLPLNTPVRMSDIVAIIEGTNGVSYTSLPFLQFCKVEDVDNPDKKVADIEASPLEYFRVISSNIIIG